MRTSRSIIYKLSITVMICAIIFGSYIYISSLDAPKYEEYDMTVVEIDILSTNKLIYNSVFITYKYIDNNDTIIQCQPINLGSCNNYNQIYLDIHDKFPIYSENKMYIMKDKNDICLFQPINYIEQIKLCIGTFTISSSIALLLAMG
ncbi:MAG: hypothetical protein Edafosvirus2_14 [Edafosvirus sp.]|uniref:Uncharacterized protein n=1 Tax=Edafosvirus sp. TaxID=2487765 RepID=A0A3G4ZSG8_9VIRU|nr:MAG: hypothetical protein Edafosvirus2_14 [Edafosvirus sp.]